MIQWPERPRILASYAYKEAILHTITQGRGDVDLMVDSGAFTAHTVGKSIDLKEYVEFVNQHHQSITTAVVLDVIGDWRGTARNHERMLETVTADVDVLPVWHSTSPIDELHRLCRTYPYIGIGGVVSMAKTVNKFMQHMIRAHKVAREYGTRLHGLGVTGNTAMMRLPWGTVDSTAWRSGHMYGNINLAAANGERTTLRAGEPIKDRRVAALVRAYGGDPRDVERKNFGRSSSSGDGSAESKWMDVAQARSFMTLEHAMRRRNVDDARVYLACAPTYAVDRVLEAHRLGSPF